MLSLLQNEKVRNNLIQAAALLVFFGGLAFMAITLKQNLDTLGITSGFGFLYRTTGWDIPFALLDYDIRSPYWRVLLIGFLNTLFTGLLGLFFATILGTIVGMARVSDNFVMRALGTTYVELFRNVPLLLQGFLWYAVATHLPGPRQAEALFGSVFFTSRGVYLPFPVITGGQFLVILILTAVLIAVLSWFWRTRGANLGTAGRWLCIMGIPVGVLALCILVPAIANPAGTPLVEVPFLKGLKIRGGLRILPEFSALVIAVVLFGASYIAEIVRGGLISVNQGQIEAATALGLRPAQIYWKVRIPLALRAIVPPMGNQYVWLMKATTIGIAIGFSDLFMIASTSINQSGQTMEILLIMMLGFLLINYTISRIMSWINKAIALKGHASSGAGGKAGRK